MYILHHYTAIYSLCSSLIYQPEVVFVLVSTLRRPSLRLYIKSSEDLSGKTSVPDDIIEQAYM